MRLKSKYVENSMQKVHLVDFRSVSSVQASSVRSPQLLVIMSHLYYHLLLNRCHTKKYIFSTLSGPNILLGNVAGTQTGTRSEND